MIKKLRLVFKYVGVNNTGNEDGERCTDNNPCEVDKNGNISAQKGAAYGQQTYQAYTCVTSDRKFDLSLPGCGLFKGD